MALPGERPRLLSGPLWPDHFSPVAPDYARYRPTYPDRLFELLAASTEPGLACDIATGSGQAAGALAKRFARVLGVDASRRQIAAGRRRRHVLYAVGRAEALPVAGRAADLVTVAQAVHWIRLEPFYDEVRRVLRPHGVFAVWTYGLCGVRGVPDAILRRFYDEVVGPYWPPQRRLVDEGYRSLPFPFSPVPLPDLAMEARWTRRELLGYVGTWSAVRRFREAHGADPVASFLAASLAEAWPDSRPRLVRWPLAVRAGRPS